MNPIEARLKCIELAGLAASADATAKDILATATMWSEFVLGPPLKESTSAGKKGADDHLADKNMQV